MSREENLRDSGRRLAKDLKDLRQDRQVDVDVLLKSTRIPPDILDKFDETALVDHPAFNRVYLRSIVSSYARVLGIDVDLVRKSLEQALEGKYENLLRKKYLDETRPGFADAFVVADSAPAKTGEPTDKSVQPESEQESTTGQADTKSSTSDQFMPNSWVIVSGVILIIAVIWSLTSLIRSDSTDIDMNSTDNAVSEKLQDAVAALPSSPPEFIVLADSMQFDIIAEFEPVDPIRISRDWWARRPYWIEHGDTLSFRAANRIIFESDIESARIELAGFALPDSFIDDGGRIDVSRERAQRWLDSLVVFRHRQ